MSCGIWPPAGPKTAKTRLPEWFRLAKDGPLGSGKSGAIAVNRMIETGRTQTNKKQFEAMVMSETKDKN